MQQEKGDKGSCNATAPRKNFLDPAWPALPELNIERRPATNIPYMRIYRAIELRTSFRDSTGAVKRVFKAYDTLVFCEISPRRDYSRGEAIFPVTNLFTQALHRTFMSLTRC